MISLCACLPDEVQPQAPDNATGLPEGTVVRVYKPVECEQASSDVPQPNASGETPVADESRYYLYDAGGKKILAEYDGPDSTHMTYTDNHWTKPGEDIFFFATPLGGGMRAGKLVALPHDASEGAVAYFLGGRGGLKLKVKKDADGTYAPTSKSSVVGADCLQPVPDHTYPPKFSGPPPWAGFYAQPGSDETP